MNHEDKRREMIKNYTLKKNQAADIHVMEFHRKHLLLFINRFRQLLDRFPSPSSSLLSHDIFLVVEAATTVAKSDWEKLGKEDAERYGSFSKYFDAFKNLSMGLAPLDISAAICVDALSDLNSA